MRYLFVLLFLIISCTAPDYSGYVRVELCTTLKTIKDIGTCDKYGNCSVVYTDNTFDVQHLPIKHKEVGVACKAWFVPPDQVDQYIERYKSMNPNLRIRIK